MVAINRIKERLDLVALVSEYVGLTQAGRNFKGLCPFHSERTPSFFVFPENQTWRCFGACTSGGDAFTFLMRMENLNFREALEFLASKTGVETRQPSSQITRSPLHELNRAAAAYYHQQLLQSSEAEKTREYLTQRGISLDSIERFNLGYSPGAAEALAKHLAGIGFNTDLMIQAGLIHNNQAGRNQSYFWRRLIFPISDENGLIVGFGGRSIDNSNPKYLNTRSTSIFNKSQILYGLHTAQDAIRDQNLGIIVEGYMDTLTAHQNGFTNVVASMGTALTRQQVSKLVGIADAFVLALDPDEAGREATVRSLESAWGVFQPTNQHSRHWTGQQNFPRRPIVDLRIAMLPPGMDPDDLIRKDPEDWIKVITSSASLPDFLLDTLPSRYDLNSSEGKLQFTERFSGLLLSLADTTQQDQLLERMEKILNVDRHTLDTAIGLSQGSLLRQKSQSRQEQTTLQGSIAPFTRAERDPIEEYTLALLFQEPQLSTQGEAISPEFFQRSENRELFTTWKLWRIIDDVRGALDPLLLEHLDMLLIRPLPSSNRTQNEKALTDCARRLEERYLRGIKNQESLLLNSTESSPERDAEYMAKILQRNSRLKELFSHNTNGRPI